MLSWDSNDAPLGDIIEFAMNGLNSATRDRQALVRQQKRSLVLLTRPH
ncbi:hypothetical protein Brsp05_03041 [Brucella sp. NBRC 12953]